VLLLLLLLLLQAYSSNLVDYHLILDLLPSLARLYLSGQLPATLSYGQVRAWLFAGERGIWRGGWRLVCVSVLMSFGQGGGVH
jgi:hypothetical protein